MAVDVANDGAAALAAAGYNQYDVIVLDRDLPVVHGDQVCRALAGVDDAAQGVRAQRSMEGLGWEPPNALPAEGRRGRNGARILMLTAATTIDDRVAGLELGADDYLGKPFAFRELIARVRALGRRAPATPPVLRHGDLTVDRARHRASRGDRTLSLTRKEFGVLEMLLAANGAVVSAEDLLEHVWDVNTDPFSRIITVTMTRLRRKLGPPPLIETVVGKGYRL
jgi:DNA-binding response OmpR family regulator